MWTITLIAVFFVLWLIYRNKSFSVHKDLGIPGPQPNIFFGNLLDFALRSPLESLSEWFEKYGKVVGYYFGTVPIVLISDLDLLKKIQISDFHKFINRPNIFRPSAQPSGPQKNKLVFNQHLLALRDKRWKEVRSIITPSFTASKMKLMAPIMNSAIDSLVKNVEKRAASGEMFDIYPMYQGLTMDVIGRTAFGIQSDTQNNPNDPLLRSSKILLAGDIRNNYLFVLASSFRFMSQFWMTLGRLKLRFLNQGLSPFNELMTTVKDIVTLRRTDKESRRPDLLQLMIDAEIDELSAITSDDLTAKADGDEKKQNTSSSEHLVRRMMDVEIVDNSLLFFLAAYETTSTALAFTTHLLLHYPEAQEKIREEVLDLLNAEGKLDYYSVNKLQYLEQVLQESLRLYPPVYLFVSRECGEDVELGNYKLKKGMVIQVPSYHIHRDPEVFGPDANEFRPERFSPENKSEIHPLAFQTFGAGPRNCVGMRFAYMEAKLAVARLLSKYKFEACSKTDKLDISLKLTSASMNPKNGIWMKAIALT